jgi:hypothetical protein
VVLAQEQALVSEGDPMAEAEVKLDEDEEAQGLEETMQILLNKRMMTYLPFWLVNPVSHSGLLIQELLAI